MYFDKEDAIEMVANAKNTIERLHNQMLTNHNMMVRNNIAPDQYTKEVREEDLNSIYELEQSIEKLEKAIQDCSSLVRNANGELV